MDKEDLKSAPSPLTSEEIAKELGARSVTDRLRELIHSGKFRSADGVLLDSIHHSGSSAGSTVEPYRYAPDYPGKTTDKSFPHYPYPSSPGRWPTGGAIPGVGDPITEPIDWIKPTAPLREFIIPPSGYGTTTGIEYTPTLRDTIQTKVLRGMQQMRVDYMLEKVSNSIRLESNRTIHLSVNVIITPAALPECFKVAFVLQGTEDVLITNIFEWAEIVDDKYNAEMSAVDFVHSMLCVGIIDLVTSKMKIDMI